MLRESSWPREPPCLPAWETTWRCAVSPTTWLPCSARKRRTLARSIRRSPLERPTGLRRLGGRGRLGRLVETEAVVQGAHRELSVLRRDKARDLDLARGD